MVLKIDSIPFAFNFAYRIFKNQFDLFGVQYFNNLIPIALNSLFNAIKHSCFIREKMSDVCFLWSSLRAVVCLL